MELTDDQMAQVIEYLKKWKTAECAICQNDDWAVSKTVYVLTEYAGTPVSGTYNVAAYTAQSVFPVIPLTCKTCGNVLFLSAIAAHVLPGVMQDLSSTFQR